MGSKLTLTAEQKRVSDAMLDYVFQSLAHGCDTKHRCLAVSGYAGTGKTTVMGYTAARLIKEKPNINIAYCAPTGKAAQVLRTKLNDFDAINEYSSVNTIHGQIYTLDNIDPTGKMTWDRKYEGVNCNLFVIDEASMVTQEMYNDLKKYHKPIIFIGDSFQLQPVNSIPFGPLKNTEWVLKDVHRQALNNPIINVATDVRNGIQIPFERKSNTFLKVQASSKRGIDIRDEFIDKLPNNDFIILCHTNKTRVSFNELVRSKLGYNSKLPQQGEQVICLKNQHKYGVFNGEIYDVQSKPKEYVSDCCYRIQVNDRYLIAFNKTLNSYDTSNIRSEMITFSKQIHESLLEHFGPYFSKHDENDISLFDFGYACSVHKSQGSEWKYVLLRDKVNSLMNEEDYLHWLYTGVTRAKDVLVILSGN